MANDVSMKISLDGISEIQSKLNDVGKSFQSFGDKLGEIGRTLTISLTAPLAAFGLAAIKMSAAMETARIGFKTMLGSAQAADKMLRELADFAATTPFEFVELREQALRMIGMGVAAKDVIPWLQAIGDHVASIGQGKDALQRIIWSLTQMGARGRLTGEELRELAHVGVNAAQIIANAMGITAADALELIDKRAITAKFATKALLDYMGGHAPGMMQKLMQTVTGLFSNLVDITKIAMISIGDDITRAFNIKEVLKGAQDGVKDLLLWWTNLSAGTRELIIQVAGLAAALGPLALGIKAITVAYATLKAIRNLNPIILSITALIAAGTLLYLNWDKVASVATQAWRYTKLIVLASIDTMIEAIQRLIAITPGFSAVFPEFVAKLVKARASIGKNISEIRKDIEDNMGKPLYDYGKTANKVLEGTEIRFRSMQKTVAELTETQKILKDLAGELKHNANQADILGETFSKRKADFDATAKALIALADVGKRNTKEFKDLKAKLEELRPVTNYMIADLVNSANRFTVTGKDMSKSVSESFSLLNEPIGKVKQSLDTNKEAMLGFQLQVAESSGAMSISMYDYGSAANKVLAGVQKRYTEKGQTVVTVQSMMEVAVRGVTTTIKSLWEGTTATFDTAWKGALSVFVDVLGQMVIQVGIKAALMQAHWAAMTAGISFVIGLIASVFGGGGGGGVAKKSAIQEATEKFLSDIQQSLTSFEDKVLTTLEKLKTATSAAKTSSSDILGGFATFDILRKKVERLNKELSDLRIKSMESMQEWGFDKFSGDIFAVRREILLTKNEIAGLIPKMLTQMTAFKDALIEEYNLKKKIAEDTIELYKRQVGFAKSMGETITGVKRDLLGPQAAFTAQLGDISALKASLAGTTGETKLGVISELKDAYITAWNSAKKVFEENNRKLTENNSALKATLLKATGVDANSARIAFEDSNMQLMKNNEELVKWQQFTVAGLEGLQAEGLTAYDQLIDVNLQMLSVQRSGVDIQTQMLAHIDNLGRVTLATIGLLEAIGAKGIANITDTDLKTLTSNLGVLGLASGGIVTKPTLAVIGEGGESEAVIPLSKLGKMGKGVSITNQYYGPVIWDDISASLFARKQSQLIQQELRRYV